MSKKRCPDCDGPEITLFGDVGSRICSECHGTGKPDLFSDPLGVVRDTFGGGEKCSACGGSGECKTCGGTGEVENDSSQSEESSFFGFRTEKRDAPFDRKSHTDDAEETARESGSTSTFQSEYERVDSGYSYGGGTFRELEWSEFLGFGLAAGIVITGIIWVIYSLAHFSPGSYKPSYLPSITSGPSGTTFNFGPNASAIQGYNDGVFLLNQGRYKESIAYFDEVVRLTPDYIFAYVQRGIAYANIRQFDRAILDYNEALRLNPNHPIARLDRGIAYANSGQYEAAIEDYTNVIGRQPTAEAYKARSYAFSSLGQYDRALEDLAAAIRLDPSDAVAFYNRGFNQASMGLFEEALTAYTAAIQLKPNYVEAYHNRGYALAALGQRERAIADFNEAIRLRPDFVDAYVNRGAAYGNLAQYPKAIADYEEALRLAPENTRAREQLETCKALATQAMDSESAATYELNGYIHQIPKPRQTDDGRIPFAPPGHGCASVRGVIQRLAIGDAPSREYELPLCGK